MPVYSTNRKKLFTASAWKARVTKITTNLVGIANGSNPATRAPRKPTRYVKLEDTIKKLRPTSH